MRCEKNEQLVNDVSAGNFPATYWAGDLFECPTCRVSFVVVYQAAARQAGVAAEVQRQRGRNTDSSITFAYSPEQREQYADQFAKR